MHRAKAGIKAPVHCTETHEQNDYITELFFRRTRGARKIELDYFTSCPRNASLEC